MQVTNNREFNTNDQKMFSINQLWSKYAAYWPLFGILLLAGMSGAWLYIRYKVPLYEANARVLIKDEKKGAEDSKAFEALNLLTTKKIIENEQEVIQSRTLLQWVVKKLSLYAPIYSEGRIKTEPAYASSPIKIEVKDPEKIQGTKKIYFEYNSALSRLYVNGKPVPLNQWVKMNSDSLRFIKNSRYNGVQKNKLFFTLVKPKDAAHGIQAGLSVSSVSKLSTILNLKYKDEVPERAEDILNELLSAYGKAVIEDKNTLASNTLSFVEDRLNIVQKDLDAIEKKVQRYKSKNGAVDISMQGKLFLENVSTNDQKLSEINMQTAVLNQIENYVRSKNNNGGLVPSTLGINDPVLPDLLNRLYQTELEYEKLKSTKAENSPALTSVVDQIEKMKPSILENIQNLRRGLQATKNNIANTNNTYASILQSIPQKERELIDINREQSIKNDIYSFLLKKREETALTHASTVSDSRIIDKAEASFIPISPKKGIVYPLSIIVALFFGIALITAKETLNNKILFRHEIESLTSYPIIGEIALDKSKSPIVINQGQKTFIAEQFRQLRIALSGLSKKKQIKRILVTSTISGEGKSFVATNLAQSLALTGKQVALLELDLNNPAISVKLDVPNEQGISDYLINEKEPEEIIKRTALNKNLFLIPSGPVPANPAELLMNGKVQELLNYLDNIFDFIVIDTAPVSPVTDAYILSPYCDVTLYVIRHKYTPKVLVQRIDENNKINELNNIAFIFNGVASRGYGKANYGFGYGYGYTYQDKRTHRSNEGLTAKLKNKFASVTQKAKS